MQNVDFLRELTGVYGVSGHEEAAKAVWMAHVEPHAARVENIPEHAAVAFAGKEGKPRVFLSAHIDEIGFLVTHVSDEGWIHFTPIDSDLIDIAAIRAKKVTIFHDGEPVSGVVGHAPFHCLPWDPNQKVEWKNLWIDIGAASKDEALKRVSIGDPIAVVRTFDVNGDTVITGALDNRVSCFVIAEVLKRFAARADKAGIELACGITVQEELDQRGAEMAAFRLKPALNIVLDVCFALDHPQVEFTTVGKLTLGGGPVIVLNSVLSKACSRKLRDVAKAEGIPLQEAAWGGQFPTDAYHMSKVQGGIPTIFIGIPLRYMHTNVEMVNLKDVEAAIELVDAYLKTDLGLD